MKKAILLIRESHRIGFEIALKLYNEILFLLPQELQKI
jgi:hypothetical protein